MQRILCLHGGNSFDSYEQYLDALKARVIDYDRTKYHLSWREWIAAQLPDDDVLTPTMPNSDNASYDEWVIYFEKLLACLGDDFTLVGHSLGAMFLAKYLHAQTLPKKARRIVLVAGRYGTADGENNGSFVVKSAAGVEKSASEVHLFHSEDDPAVPYEDMAKFARDIPAAIVHSFSDRGHFTDSTFPEMLELLRQK